MAGSHSHLRRSESRFSAADAVFKTHKTIAALDCARQLLKRVRSRGKGPRKRGSWTLVRADAFTVFPKSPEAIWPELARIGVTVADIGRE